jgi:CxxC motif-containing protein (DUF1111 family)
MKRTLCLTLCCLLAVTVAGAQGNFTEAPAGFDNQTNGMLDPASFVAALVQFTSAENASTGLGPVFNGVSCVQCHASGGAIGGSSQITELRAGRLENIWGYRWGGRYPYGRRDQNESSYSAKFGKVFAPADGVLNTGEVIEGRSLINQRAICEEAQTHIQPQDNITTRRMSLSVLGDGFVEAVPDETFRQIAQWQYRKTRGRVHGQVIEVPVLEADGVTAVGRFGWKNQHASLLSFSADAYLNEMGITTTLLPDEVTLTCHPSNVPIPNDDNEDLEAFTAFMRSTKVPPRDPNLVGTPQVVAGEQVFNAIGCATCHVSTLMTAAAGTPILGGTFVVPEALGNKIIHPYSDFLLHDVGTGDGIVQNGNQETRNKLRTTPLWGLRTRTELMHDGESYTLEDAIDRHSGEGLGSTRAFQSLSNSQKQAVLAFLRSL